MTERKAGEQSEFTKAHERRQAKRKVRKITVPEFGTAKKPLALYAYPLTMNDAIELDGRYATIGERNIMQIIRQCMDAKGDQYFTVHDKSALMNSPSDVIGKILIELNGESSSFAQELKKNND